MTSRWLIGLGAAAWVSCATLAAQGPGRQGGAPGPKAAEGSSASDQSAKAGTSTRIPLSTGKTEASPDAPNTFQRELLAPADQAQMASGPVYGMTFEEFYNLAKLPKDQRSRQVRDVLGVPDTDALILSEIGEAILDSAARLKPESHQDADRFGLQIEFPGTEATAKPVATLTFGDDAETHMKADVDAAVTGIDVFVDVKGKDQAADVSRDLECQLFDNTKKPVGSAPIVSGYCVFPGLPVDQAFGRRTYYVQIGAKPGGNLKVTEDPLTGPVQQVAVVKAGERTRLSYQVSVTTVRGAAPASTATATPDPTTTLMGWAKAVTPLDAVMQVLPQNPGLHLGGVEVPGSGFHWIFAVRYFLKAPTTDRRAKFVDHPHGRFLLQVLTPLGTDVAEHQHYLKITWVARAEPEDLSLSSRPTKQIPIGLTVGVVPALSPTMYTIGMSYKLHPTLEVFAAAGIRKGLSTRLVYGFTVDMMNLAGLFSGGSGSSSKPPASGGGK